MAYLERLRPIITIDLVMTVDPVSLWDDGPSEMLSHLLRWVNVYPSGTLLIPGRWESESTASRNVGNDDWGHGWFATMYSEVEDEVARLLGGRG